MLVYKYPAFQEGTPATELEAGHYVVDEVVHATQKVTRTIAEYSDGSWYPIGCDYDDWSCSPEEYEIRVIARIYLESLTIFEVI